MPAAGEFMQPASKVVTVYPDSTLRAVAVAMAQERVGCVVVQDGGMGGKPVGILTQSDVVKAWTMDAKLEDPVSMHMSTALHACLPGDSRDAVAELLFNNKVHHALVCKEDGSFLGLVSSWDIAREAALDAKAWPWTRHAPAAAADDKEKIPYFW